MITVHTFFSGTMNTVDAVIGGFVNIAYTNFVEANSNLITLLFTVYVMFLGYQLLTHNLPFGLSTLNRHLITLLCVYGMIMNWDLYNLFVYNIFTNEPGNLAKVLVDSTGKLEVTGNIAETLDSIYDLVVTATLSLFGKINFVPSGLAFLLYGVLVYIIGTLMCVFALLLFIYAKMMMAVSLALGPIFILFVLWEPTKGMFSAWLNKLVTIALIPIVTSAILMLMLSVVKVTLGELDLPAEKVQFSGISPFLGLSVATTLILSQVFRICSSLGGGITLASLSAGAAIVSASLKHSGVTAASLSVADWTQRKVNKVKQNLFRGES